MASVSNEEGASLALTKNFQIIPISTEPGDVQLFSYLQPLEYEYNGAQNIQLYFTDMDDKVLQFNFQGVGHAGNPYITFIYE